MWNAFWKFTYNLSLTLNVLNKFLPLQIMTLGPVKVCVLAYAVVYHSFLVFTFLQVGIVLITCMWLTSQKYMIHGELVPYSFLFKLLLFGVTCGITDTFTERYYHAMNFWVWACLTLCLAPHRHQWQLLDACVWRARAIFFE